jgi:hypothetical protein
MTAIWKMPVTLRNRLGMGRRQSAPDGLASSECEAASRPALSGFVPSREISPDASCSRRRRAPISCRRKPATAMRNATHIRSGGVSTVRSFSTGAHPLRLMRSLVVLCPCPWPLAGRGAWFGALSARLRLEADGAFSFLAFWPTVLPRLWPAPGRPAAPPWDVAGRRLD